MIEPAMVDRAILVRAAALYVPIMVTAVLCLRQPPKRRQTAGMLLGFSWNLSALLWLEAINLRAHFWNYHASGGLIMGMPVDLYLGWALAWSALPCLAFRRQQFWLVIAAMFALDLVAMPLCAPVVELTRRWLLGEAVALALVLVPAQLFARWTSEDSHLYGRATMHVVSSGSLLLFVLPESIFSVLHQDGWQALLGYSPAVRSLLLQGAILLAIPGVAAVQEFAMRGGGTPVPFDPPKRLVTIGLYGYVGSPMQLSCVLLLTYWGIILQSFWIAMAGAMAMIYGMGLARWSEDDEMPARFGARWGAYRANVHALWPRLRPWRDETLPNARIYIAENCGPCSELRRWFERQSPAGLEILAAEHHPTRSLRRITYDPCDGSAEEEGLAALARGLEHLHLGWALMAAGIRLPIIRPFLQLLCDASGFGPQTIANRAECPIPQAAEEVQRVSG